MFNLLHFERLVYRRDWQGAAQQLVILLRLLDDHYGKYDPWMEVDEYTSAMELKQAEEYISNRLALAVTALLTDPNFLLSRSDFQVFAGNYRWIAAIIGASALTNGDHALRTLVTALGSRSFQLAARDVAKAFLLFTPESAIDISLDHLWSFDKVMTASFCLGLLSARFAGSPAAHAKRNEVLGWLAERLMEIEDIELLPVSILHDVYMQCSYADFRGRHDIKRAINHLIRVKNRALGLTDVTAPAEAPPRERPVMLVVLDWFTAGHSIYRTHSRTLLAAREYFDLIGAGLAANIDDVGRAVFHQFIELGGQNTVGDIQILRQLAADVTPDVLYMPSVGMSMLTIAASNLRLARLQIAALGHPATTHSDKIDFISVEEDFVGDSDCFSEKLMLLPCDGQPYIQSARTPAAAVKVVRHPRPEVHIAVTASCLKINPTFLNTCGTLARTSPTPVRFQFLIGLALGVVERQVAKVLRAALGDAAVCHGHQEFTKYMSILTDCDMFLSPFPLGNTNGVVDSLTVGLPGVCLRGPEVFEMIDSALFARAGLPDWLVADTIEDYLRAALRLAQNHDERTTLRDTLIGETRVQRFFHGDAAAFPRAVLSRLGQLEP
jgi:HMW1 domain 2/HMW1C N-terminal